MKPAAAILIALLSSAGAGAEPRPARVELRLAPSARAAAAVAVRALDRDVPQKMTGQTVAVRTVDGRAAEDGGWLVEGLAPGRYDLLIETENGKFEGYTLRPEEDSEVELTDKDREKIAEIFAHLKTFENQKRIIALDGNGHQAVALVELLRTGKTSNERKAPDSVIWRVEYWSFEKLYGVWRRGDSKVLRRFVMPRTEFENLNWNFVPELGGLELAAGEEKKIEWRLPERFDPAAGRAAEDAEVKPAPATRKEVQ